MTRKPDYVFDIWNDGLVFVVKSQWWAESPAWWLKAWNDHDDHDDHDAHDGSGLRLTHRIRVFMKAKT